MRSRTFVAMLRIVFSAREEMHAKRTAEWFARQLEETLEPSDDIKVTQVLAYGDSPSPDEEINMLKRARNILVKLNYKDTMYLAEEIDKRICLLEARMIDEDAHAPNYDYSRIEKVMKLQQAGEDPLI